MERWRVGGANAEFRRQLSSKHDEGEQKELLEMFREVQLRKSQENSLPTQQEFDVEYHPDYLAKFLGDLDLSHAKPRIKGNWNIRVVENTSIVWISQFLNGGSQYDLDRFVLSARSGPSQANDVYSDDHHSIVFSLVIWSLFLKGVNTRATKTGALFRFLYQRAYCDLTSTYL